MTTSIPSAKAPSTLRKRSATKRCQPAGPAAPPFETVRVVTSLKSPSSVDPDAGDTVNGVAQNPSTHIQNVYGTLRRVWTVPPLVQRMYRDNQRHVRRLGDSSVDDPMNGEFTQGSIQRLLHQMIQTTKLGGITNGYDPRRLHNGCVFADIGSGTGKVVLHAAACIPGMPVFGLEISKIRYMISIMGQKDALERKEEHSTRVHFKHDDILQIDSLGELTHVYVASAAFPDPVMHHLAQLWNNSSAAKYLICNHAARQLYVFGFCLKDLDVKVQCRMHGSGEGKTFYFYERLADDKATDVIVSAGSIACSMSDLDCLRRRCHASCLEQINKTLSDFQNEPVCKRLRRPVSYTVS